MKRLVSLTVIVLLIFSFTSCFTTGKKETNPIDSEPEPVITEITVTRVFERKEQPENPYADEALWLARPEGEEITKPIDVFYVFPPEYGMDAYEIKDGELDYLFEEEEPNPDDPEATVDGTPDNSDTAGVIEEELEEEVINPFVAKWPYYEAAHLSIFSEECNIYAPLYTPENPIKYCDYSEEERETLLRRSVVPDITKAFAYYMNKINNGRPFILVGNSEGAAALLLMMKDLFDNPLISNNMIAAYLLGTSVTERDMKEYPFLRFVQQSDDTGVIISWNTEGEKVTANNPYVFDDTLVINPTTWSYTEEFISNSKHKGATFYDDEGNKIIDINKFSSTQIDPIRRVLVAFNPDSGFYTIWNSQRVPRGVYHLQDFTFFFENIRMNVKERIASYLDK